MYQFIGNYGVALSLLALLSLAVVAMLYVWRLGFAACALRNEDFHWY